MKTLLSTLLIVFLLASCGGPKNQSKLRLVVSNIATGGVNMPGGLLLYAKSSLGEELSINFSDVTEEGITFNNGEWNFFVVGWDGANPMEGTPKCGATSLSLTGGDHDLSLAIGAENCNNPLGEALNFINASDFSNLAAWSCDPNPTSPTISSNCSATKGTAASLKIALLAGANGALGTPLLSQCYDLSNATLTLPTKIPYGVAASIKLFNGYGCTGIAEKVDLPNGVKNQTAATFDIIGTKYSFASDATNALLFFENASFIAAGTPPVATGALPAAFNEDTDTVITLQYTDAQSDLATACSISNMVGLSIVAGGECACNIDGICSVTVRGNSNLQGIGVAGFNFTVTANAQGSAPVSVTFDINNIDDQAVVEDVAITSIQEDLPQTITFGYSDVDGDTTSTCNVTGDSSLSFTTCICDATQCSFDVQGLADFYGTGLMFSYSVTTNGLPSNSISKTIDVVNTPDAPQLVGTPIPVTFDEETSSSISFSVSDVDNDTLNCTVTAVDPTAFSVDGSCSCTSGTCSVGVTGLQDKQGSFQYDYSVSDGTHTVNGIQTSLYINNIPDAPVATTTSNADLNEDFGSASISLTYTHPEGNVATECAATSVGAAFATPTCTCSLGICTLSFDSVANQSGSNLTIGYTITGDGLTSLEQIITLNVLGSDDPPVATAPAITQVDRTASVFTINLPYTDVDSANSEFSCSVPLSPPGIISLNCACNSTTGVCTATGIPDSTYLGHSTFDFTISDSTSTSVPVTADVLLFDPDVFISTWETTGASETIELPVLGATNCYFHVDWGDGSSEYISSCAANPSHVYAAIGTYTMQIKGSLSKWSFNNDVNSSKSKIRTVTSLGDLGWIDLSGAFSGSLLNSFAGGVTSSVTNMSNMFYACGSLTTIDLTSFDTTNVTDMSGMFGYDSSLYSLDLSSFNTVNVTNMSNMFYGMQNVTSLDFSAFPNFVTTNVTSMASMFESMYNISFLDLSSFDMTNVSDISRMFANMLAIQKLKLDGWNPSIGTFTDIYLSTPQEMVVMCDQAGQPGTGSLYGKYCELDCPVGYVSVPADQSVGADSSFCVMKYEAKNDGSGNAISSEVGMPWVNISHDGAKTECTSLGIGYDLISNPEWMAIARNAEQVSENWAGAMGASNFVKGWSSGTNTGFAPDSTTANLHNIGTDSGSGAGTVDTRRTHILMSGRQIWDMSGNADEWVNWKIDSGVLGYPYPCSSLIYIDLNDDTLMKSSCPSLAGDRNSYRPLDPNYNSTFGFGQIMGNTGPNRSIVRGGDFNGGTYSGIYQLDLPSYGTAYATTGFRCVYRPESYIGHDLDLTASHIGKELGLKGGIMVTLPTSRAAGDMIHFFNQGFEDVKINAGGSDTIDATNLQLTLSGGIGAVTLTFEGGNWISSDSVGVFSSHIKCPKNYNPVLANATLGTNDFCVMKYEAKNDGAGYPESRAEGFPYVNVSATDAYAKCDYVLPSGFPGTVALISNPEWMTIARDLENNPNNWSGGSVGNGAIPVGNSDGDPLMALAVNNLSDPFNGTNNSTGNQERTLYLSTGHVMWDFAGNVMESVDWDLSTGFTPGPTDSSAMWRELSSLSGSFVVDDLAPLGAYTSVHGMGQWYGGSGGAAIRGGGFSQGIPFSGIYALNLSQAPSAVNNSLGFRCVYRP